jgi:galactokinase
LEGGSGGGGTSDGPDERALLGNITIDEFKTYKGLLQGVYLLRAEHFFGECERVQQGVEAWRAGDMVTFGKLISASGESSITKYECGSEPLIQLREVLLKTKGVLGARFSGAGFRGCCVALVVAGEAQLAVEEIRSKYAQVQPELAAQGQVLIVDSADGARIL